MIEVDADERNAWARVQAGDSAGAERIARAALEQRPDAPGLLLALGGSLRRQGRLAEAIRALDGAVRAAPDDADAWLERGFLFDGAGSLANAAASYRKAIALSPTSATAHAGLGAVLQRSGQREEARASASLALSLAPDNPTAAITLARLEIERGEATAARSRLTRLLAVPDLPVDDRLKILYLLADASDAMSAAEQAFAEYQEANALFAERLAPRFVGLPTFVEHVGAVRDSVRRAGLERFTAQPSDERERGHAFLIGFPRSGTTLVENILATSPEVKALEERPTLREADQAFLESPERLADLAALGQAELDGYRAAYWRRVAAAGIGARTRLFVDMDPLKGLKLPLIARLFPAARIVVMRRDPRDVVWSCFRTAFVPSSAAHAFTTLEGTARAYAALMRLMQDCFDVLPLEVHELRYDRLVADFDATTRELCAFLDIAWTPELRRFDRTAQRRGVTTASQTQVRRGLYDGGGQWRRYAERLEPVLPILAPWIDRFGFGIS